MIYDYTSNLFLGCRFAGPYADAARACINYVDVASVNSYVINGQNFHPRICGC